MLFVYIYITYNIFITYIYIEQEQVRKYDYYVNGTKINKRAKAVGYVWKIAAEGITGLRAHTKYWKNEGVLKFILEKIECS